MKCKTNVADLCLRPGWKIILLFTHTPPFSANSGQHLDERLCTAESTLTVSGSIFANILEPACRVLFQLFFTPSKPVSIDAAMIAFRGRIFFRLHQRQAYTLGNKGVRPIYGDGTDKQQRLYLHWWSRSRTWGTTCKRTDFTPVPHLLLSLPPSRRKCHRP